MSSSPVPQQPTSSSHHHHHPMMTMLDLNMLDTPSPPTPHPPHPGSAHHIGRDHGGISAGKSADLMERFLTGAPSPRSRPQSARARYDHRPVPSVALSLVDNRASTSFGSLSYWRSVASDPSASASSLAKSSRSPRHQQQPPAAAAEEHQQPLLSPSKPMSVFDRVTKPRSRPTSAIPVHLRLRSVTRDPPPPPRPQPFSPDSTTPTQAKAAITTTTTASASSLIVTTPRRMSLTPQQQSISQQRRPQSANPYTSSSRRASATTPNPAPPFSPRKTVVVSDAVPSPSRPSSRRPSSARPVSASTPSQLQQQSSPQNQNSPQVAATDTTKRSTSAKRSSIWAVTPSQHEPSIYTSVTAPVDKSAAVAVALSSDEDGSKPSSPTDASAAKRSTAGHSYSYSSGMQALGGGDGTMLSATTRQEKLKEIEAATTAVESRIAAANARREDGLKKTTQHTDRREQWSVIVLVVGLIKSMEWNLFLKRKMRKFASVWRARRPFLFHRRRRRLRTIEVVLTRVPDSDPLWQAAASRLTYEERREQESRNRDMHFSTTGGGGGASSSSSSYLVRPTMANLKADKILQWFPDDKLEGILASLELRVFQPLDIVVYQGSHGSETFIVAEGSATVCVDGAVIQIKNADGVESPLYLRKGAVVGSPGMVSGEPRMATIQAAAGEELVCWVADKAKLEAAHRRKLGIASPEVSKAPPPHHDDIMPNEGGGNRDDGSGGVAGSGGGDPRSSPVEHTHFLDLSDIHRARDFIRSQHIANIPHLYGKKYLNPKYLRNFTAFSDRSLVEEELLEHICNTTTTSNPPQSSSTSSPSSSPTTTTSTPIFCTTAHVPSGEVILPLNDPSSKVVYALSGTIDLQIPLPDLQLSWIFEDDDKHNHTPNKKSTSRPTSPSSAGRSKKTMGTDTSTSPQSPGAGHNNNIKTTSAANGDDVPQYGVPTSLASWRLRALNIVMHAVGSLSLPIGIQRLQRHGQLMEGRAAVEAICEHWAGMTAFHRAYPCDANVLLSLLQQTYLSGGAGMDYVEVSGINDGTFQKFLSTLSPLVYPKNASSSPSTRSSATSPVTSPTGGGHNNKHFPTSSSGSGQNHYNQRLPQWLKPASKAISPVITLKGFHTPCFVNLPQVLQRHALPFSVVSGGGGRRSAVGGVDVYIGNRTDLIDGPRGMLTNSPFALQSAIRSMSGYADTSAFAAFYLLQMFPRSPIFAAIAPPPPPPPSTNHHHVGVNSHVQKPSATLKAMSLALASSSPLIPAKSINQSVNPLVSPNLMVIPNDDGDEDPFPTTTTTSNNKTGGRSGGGGGLLHMPVLVDEEAFPPSTVASRRTTGMSIECGTDPSSDDDIFSSNATHCTKDDDAPPFTGLSGGLLRRALLNDADNNATSLMSGPYGDVPDTDTLRSGNTEDGDASEGGVRLHREAQLNKKRQRRLSFKPDDHHPHNNNNTNSHHHHPISAGARPRPIIKGAAAGNIPAATSRYGVLSSVNTLSGVDDDDDVSSSSTDVDDENENVLTITKDGGSQLPPIIPPPAPIMQEHCVMSYTPTSSQFSTALQRAFGAGEHHHHVHKGGSSGGQNDNYYGGDDGGGTLSRSHDNLLDALAAGIQEMSASKGRFSSSNYNQQGGYGGPNVANRVLSTPASLMNRRMFMDHMKRSPFLGDLLNKFSNEKLKLPNANLALQIRPTMSKRDSRRVAATTRQHPCEDALLYVSQLHRWCDQGGRLYEAILMLSAPQVAVVHNQQQRNASVSRARSLVHRNSSIMSASSSATAHTGVITPTATTTINNTPLPPSCTISLSHGTSVTLTAVPLPQPPPPTPTSSSSLSNSYSTRYRNNTITTTMTGGHFHQRSIIPGGGTSFLGNSSSGAGGVLPPYYTQEILQHTLAERYRIWARQQVGQGQALVGKETGGLMKKDKVVDMYHRIIQPLTFPTDHHYHHNPHHHTTKSRANSPRSGSPRSASPKSKPLSASNAIPHPPPPLGPTSTLVLPQAVVSQYVQSIQTTIPSRLKKIETKTGVMGRVVQDHFNSWPSFTPPDGGGMSMMLGGGVVGGDGRVIILPPTRQLLRAYIATKTKKHQHISMNNNNNAQNTSTVLTTLSSPMLFSSSPSASPNTNTHHQVPGTTDIHNISEQSIGGGSSTTTASRAPPPSSNNNNNNNPLNSSTLHRGGSHHNASSSIYPPPQPLTQSTTTPLSPLLPAYYDHLHSRTEECGGGGNDKLGEEPWAYIILSGTMTMDSGVDGYRHQEGGPQASASANPPTPYFWPPVHMIYFCSANEWLGLFEDIPIADSTSTILSPRTTTSTLYQALFSKPDTYSVGSPTSPFSNRNTSTTTDNNTTNNHTTDQQQHQSTGPSASSSKSCAPSMRSVVTSPSVVYVRVPRASAIACVDAMILGRCCDTAPRDVSESLEATRMVETHAAFRAMLDNYKYTFGRAPIPRMDRHK